MKHFQTRKGVFQIYIYTTDSADKVAECVAEAAGAALIRLTGDIATAVRSFDIDDDECMTDSHMSTLFTNYYTYVADGSEMCFISKNRFGFKKFKKITSGSMYCDVIAFLPS